MTSAPSAEVVTSCWKSINLSKSANIGLALFLLWIPKIIGILYYILYLQGVLRSMTYDELDGLLGQVEENMKKDNHFLYSFYQDELSGKRAFTGAMNKLLSECSLRNTVNRANGLKLLTPMITFHEILWYVYLLPWDQVSDVIPDYTMDNRYSNYYYEKIRRRKNYYVSNMRIKDDGDMYCASINITSYARSSLDAINATGMAEKTLDEVVADIQTKIRGQWSVTDKASRGYGAALIKFPLISELSLGIKKTFFIVDLGCYVYDALSEINIPDEEQAIIPKSFLVNKLVDVRKTYVTPDIVYNKDDYNIELKKSHTIFDIIPQKDDDNIEYSLNKIEHNIESLKGQNRTFANVTPRDFKGLSNLLQAFSYNVKDTPNMMNTTMGKLTDIIMRGIVATSRGDHRLEVICDALRILHKWTHYYFDFDVYGHVNVFNYIAGSYASPNALANAIETDAFIGIADKSNLPDGSVQSMRQLQILRLQEVENMPVKLEISNIFREAFQYELMGRRFSENIKKIPASNTSLTTMIYNIIELKRKDSGYPSEMYFTYKDCSKYLMINIKKSLFLKRMGTCIDQLMDIHAIKDAEFIDTADGYYLTFYDEI